MTLALSWMTTISLPLPLLFPLYPRYILCTHTGPVCKLCMDSLCVLTSVSVCSLVSIPVSCSSTLAILHPLCVHFVCLPLPQSIDVLVTQLHSQPTSSSQMAMQAQFGATAFCPRNPILPPPRAPPAVSHTHTPYI